MDTGSNLTSPTTTTTTAARTATARTHVATASCCSHSLPLQNGAVVLKAWGQHIIVSHPWGWQQTPSKPAEKENQQSEMLITCANHGNNANIFPKLNQYSSTQQKCPECPPLYLSQFKLS